MVYIQAVGCGGHSTEKEGEAAVDMQLVAAEETEERGGANGEEEGREGGNSLLDCLPGGFTVWPGERIACCLFVTLQPVLHKW